ncbi:hypothetical protein LIER_17788 [Lithospermum erythrorhizon]|uniref:Uncharacterized protein n=1 Tax=Lithospermum erythrorhizon TaxID=34254 RepID=A0AAV3QFT1_LITER
MVLEDGDPKFVFKWEIVGGEAKLTANRGTSGEVREDFERRSRGGRDSASHYLGHFGVQREFGRRSGLGKSRPKSRSGFEKT